ncbi:MAG: aminotransferase DegT [Phycisphaerae bacterium]|nr:aminotransferase DegT [Phycisphaerae bacterium]
MKFLDLQKQQKIIKKTLDKRMERVLNDSSFIMGPEVRELENRLRDFSKVKYAITCASGTDALMLAMMAMNIGAGDAVFCPSFTFPATAEAIAITGATPIFVDVGTKTFNICYKDLERNIENLENKKLNAKAVLAVDLFGLPANYSKLTKIAGRYNLKVISDAAQSYGGKYQNKAVGSLADITCTSFFPAKPLGCYGDGGAIFTDDELLKENTESLRAHGKGKTKYEIIKIGLNSRLDTIQAAILLSKLEVFEAETLEKNRLAEIYNSELSNHYQKPLILKNSKSSWAQYTLKSNKRDKITSFLKEQNIPTMIYYPVPMHKQPAYKKYLLKNSQLKNSEKLSSEVFSIPIHPYLSELQLEYIIENLNKVSKKF